MQGPLASLLRMPPATLASKAKAQSPSAWRVPGLSRIPEETGGGEADPEAPPEAAAAPVCLCAAGEPGAHTHLKGHALGSALPRHRWQGAVVPMLLYCLAMALALLLLYALTAGGAPSTADHSSETSASSHLFVAIGAAQVWLADGLDTMRDTAAAVQRAALQ